MMFAIGVACGLLLGPAWHLVQRWRAMRGASYVNVDTKGRREMLARSGER